MLLLLRGWIFAVVAFSLPIPQVQAHIHERDLGLENSDDLRKASEELLTNGRLDPIKLSKFQVKTQTRRDELYKLLYDSSRADGTAEEKAVKKATEDSRIIVLDYMLNKIKAVAVESNPNRMLATVKELLRLSSSYVKDGRVTDIVQVLEIIKVSFFEKHIVPLDDNERQPASNLVDPVRKRYLTKAEVTQAVSSGRDVSRFEPPNSSFWTKPEAVAKMNPLLDREVKDDLPRVFIYKKVKKSDHHPKISVKTNDKKKEDWKLKFGREVSPEYVAARFMRLLGFNIDESYLLNDVKVYFEDGDSFEAMHREWISFYRKDKEKPELFVKEHGHDEGGEFVIFHHALGEFHPEREQRVGPFHMSMLGNYERREVRAQLLAQAFISNTDIKEAHNNKMKVVADGNGEFHVEELIHDLGKSFGNLLVANLPNAYGWSFLEERRGNVNFKYQRYHAIEPSKNPLLVGTFSDQKWLARYLTSISYAQFETILNHSGWPEPMAKFILAKMVARRNEVVRVFKLESEIFQGERISLWDEVSPRNYDDGDLIKDGRIVKSYKEGNWGFDFASGVGVNFDFTGTFLKLIIEGVTAGLREVHWDKFINLDEDYGEVTVNKYLGVVGVRLGREIKRSPSGLAANVWQIDDKVEVFLNAGAGVEIPVATGVDVEIEAHAFFGKEFTLTSFAPTLNLATTLSLRRLFKLPFKWDEIVAALQPGESAGTGVFVGLDLKEELIAGSSFAVGAAVGMKQRKKFLVHNLVHKVNDGVFEVTHEKSLEFGGKGYIAAELFKFLKIDLISASFMLGKSDGKKYYFDFKANNDIKQIEAYNQLTSGSERDVADAVVPHSTITKRFNELSWRISLLSGLGGTYRGSKVRRLDPDGASFNSYQYTAVTDITNAMPFRTRQTRVDFNIDFEDDDFKVPSGTRTLEAAYMTDNTKTRLRDVTELLAHVNGVVGGAPIIKLTPDLFATQHFEKVLSYHRIKFKEEAIACLMDGTGCAGRRIEDHTQDWGLRLARKHRNPIKRIRAIGHYVSKQIMKEEDFELVRDYVGIDKFGHEVYINGEFLPTEKEIHLVRGMD